MKKILLVGGNGYIGKNLLSKLMNINTEVINFSTSIGNGIDPTSGTFKNSISIPAGTYAVVYLAQSPFYRDFPNNSSHLLSVNSVSAVKVAEAAREVGVEKFIYLSTGAVYAPSFIPLSENFCLRKDNLYALSKIHAEECLNLFRDYMDVIIVRPFCVYGPGQQGKLIPNLIESIKNKKPIILQPRTKNNIQEQGLRISLCYINDLVDILIKLIFQKSQDCINIASPEALSILQIASKISEKLEIDLNFTFSDKNRDTDLIANTEKIFKIHSEFIRFDEGISNVLKN